MGFQTVEGMREVYGQNVAEEITGLCNNKALLRLESPTSASWASELFGKKEEMDRRESLSRSRNGKGLLPSWGRSRTWAEQRMTTEAVFATEIMTLPPAGPENGLCGYFLTRTHGGYRGEMSWKTVMSLLPKSSSNVANFMPRSLTAQYLQEWRPDDLKRLSLQPVRLAGAQEAEAAVHSKDTKQGPRRLRTSST